MTRLLSIVGVALSLVAIQARIAGASSSTVRNSTDPAIRDGSAQRELNEARAAWRSAGIRSYRYELLTSCFCAPASRRERYIVRRGVPQHRPDGLHTIPRRFARVQRAIDDKAHKLRVTYGRYGLPVTFYEDAYEYVSDEELYFERRRFSRLPD